MNGPEWLDLYVNMYVNVYVNVYVDMYVDVYVDVYVNMYVNLYVNMCVNMYVNMYASCSVTRMLSQPCVFVFNLDSKPWSKSLGKVDQSVTMKAHIACC